MTAHREDRPTSRPDAPGRSQAEVPRLWSVVEAAAKLGVTEDWLAKAARDGVVPSRKIGQKRRFLDQDLLDYLESVRQGIRDPFARNARSQAKVGRTPHRSGPRRLGGAS